MCESIQIVAPGGGPGLTIVRSRGTIWRAMGSIGESPSRPDGMAKVSGAACYADDLAPPGLRYGATVRSPHARARIRAIRFDRERAPEGSICVTAADLKGPNAVRLIETDWPILAAGEARHVGEPVALVAAGSRLEARRAAAAGEVDWEPLSPILSLAQAEAAKSEPLASVSLERGDVEAALAAAAMVIEGSYSCGHQEHIYIECQAMTAW